MGLNSRLAVVSVVGTTIGCVILEGTFRQIPPDHKGGYDLESRVVTAKAPDYDAAYAQLQQQTPEGWMMLYVRSL